LEARFSLEKKKLELKHTWAIARGATDIKENLIVKMQIDKLQGLGEVAFNSRYGENLPDIKDGFEEFLSVYNGEDFDFYEFAQFLETLELANSLRFGLESAYIHAVLRKDKIPVHTYFKLDNPKGIKTSLSIPIMSSKDLEKAITQYGRFKSLKIKVDSRNGAEVLDLVTSLTDQPLRIDANEAWEDYDDLMRLLKKHKESNIEFIEQPFQEGFEDEYRQLKKESPFPIFADESVTDSIAFERIADQFHGVNIKLMKSGGYIKAIEQLKRAKQLGLKTMLGCMIESTLGISCAIEISSLADYFDLDGFLHLKEDPFNLVEEKFGQLYLKKNNFR
jgi:L-alanine-DL-glutamate epimerase-like enolase superfamily enzyme